MKWLWVAAFWMQKCTFSGISSVSPLWINTLKPIKNNGHLTCFAEHACVSGSAFLDIQESFQAAKMKDICGGDFCGIICQWRSGPYSTTVKTSCQSKDLEKPKHGMVSVLDTLAVTNSVNSCNSRPEVVCHLLSSCEHASITSKSDSEVFEFSESAKRAFY